MSDEWTRHATDPDGRDVVFDAGSHLHLARGARSKLLDHVDALLAAVEAPDFREDDPVPGAPIQEVPRRELWARCSQRFAFVNAFKEKGAGRMGLSTSVAGLVVRVRQRRHHARYWANAKASLCCCTQPEGVVRTRAA
jgi:hypothetical protein